MISGQRYYISTGAKNNYYTLREEWDEPVYYKDERGVQEGGVRHHDAYIKRLSIDLEKAQRMAKEYTGQALTADFEVKPIGQRHEVDWSFFQSGKYAGEAVVDVIEKDKDYAIWYAESAPPSYQKTKELLQSLLKNELELLNKQRAAKQEAFERDKQERMEKNREIIERLRAQTWSGFCQSIATSLEQGEKISDKAFNIVCDILAKQEGRRNSKAYEAEYDRIIDEFYESLTGKSLDDRS